MSKKATPRSLLDRPLPHIPSSTMVGLLNWPNGFLPQGLCTSCSTFMQPNLYMVGFFLSFTSGGSSLTTQSKAGPPQHSALCHVTLIYILFSTHHHYPVCSLQAFWLIACLPPRLARTFCFVPALPPVPGIVSGI